MSTPVIGHGGYLIRKTVSGGSTPFDANKRFDVGAWSYSVNAIVANATESDGGGWSQGLTGLYDVVSLTVDVIQKVDVADIFELSCATLGSPFDIWCKKGNAARGDLFEGTILQSIGKTCRSDDGSLLMCQFVFTKGVLSLNIVAPTLP